MVLLNAATAIYCAKTDISLQDALQLASSTLDSGDSSSLFPTTMYRIMNSILHKIHLQKMEEVALLKQKSGSDIYPKIIRRDFIKALKTHKEPAIIAEIKKASPSKGLLCDHFNPAAIAQEYAAHGARCLSVLTDTCFFQGHNEDLLLAKNACDLPVLRKDFIIDPIQIEESYHLGADCILLIVALLDSVQLQDFCQMAQDLNMAVLVESHTKEELEQALNLPTVLMGINNRSLHTFHTDLQTSISLKNQIPADKIPVSESGIHNHSDILLLQSHDIHAFLIGETLMRMENKGAGLSNLMTGKQNKCHK